MDFWHGRDVDFWYDSWLREVVPLIHHIDFRRLRNIQRVSIAEMANPSGDWLWHLFDFFLPSEILLRIVTVKRSHPLVTNYSFGWKMNCDLSFTLKSTCALRSGLSFGHPGEIWLLVTIPHIVVVAFVGVAIEDIDHVLWLCPLATQVWIELVRHERLAEFFSLDVCDWINANLSCSDRHTFGGHLDEVVRVQHVSYDDNRVADKLTKECVV
ncbi:hypothetical protein V6N13_053888 [Hibiscus sabdariffa]